jgi:hypothetical protein
MHHCALRGEGVPLPRALVPQQALALCRQVRPRIAAQRAAAALPPLRHLLRQVRGASPRRGQLPGALCHLGGLRMEPRPQAAVDALPGGVHPSGLVKVEGPPLLLLHPQESVDQAQPAGAAAQRGLQAGRGQGFGMAQRLLQSHT